MTTKYSDKLQQNITINPDNSVKCQDGTIYSKSELSKIQNLSDTRYMAIHKLKSAFNGEIVEI